MTPSASVKPASLIRLKATESYPLGLAVYAADFGGNQSLAARQALALILNQTDFALPSLSVDHPISKPPITQQRDPYQSTDSTSAPCLDESTYPYRLASGDAVSFSHSESRVVIALAPPKFCSLGVDTEIRPVTAALAQRFFSVEEIRLIESYPNHTHYMTPDLLRQTTWMIKEAHGKAAGLTLFEAIAYDMSAVLRHVIHHLENLKDPDSPDWTAHHGGFEFTGNLERHWAVCTRRA